MNKLFHVPIWGLFTLLIPTIGVYIYIIMTSLWYVKNQQKIHYYIKYGYVDGYEKAEKNYKKDEYNKNMLEELK